MDERYLSTDTVGSTGDGIVMAREAIGAAVTNMFHPNPIRCSNPETGEISFSRDTRFDGAVLTTKRSALLSKN